MRSDILESVRNLADLFPPFEQIIGSPIRLRIIVDACIVNSDLRWLLGRRLNPDSRTNLQELIDAGTVTAYAPVCLESELAEHYPEISRDLDIPVEQVHQEWLSYKKRIKLYKPQSKLPGKVSISDNDDVDYGIAFFELAANAVLTEDKGFQGSGIPIINKQIIINLRKYSRDSAWHYSLHYSGAMLGVVAGSAIEEFIRYAPTLWSRIENIPKAIKIICLLAVLFVFIHPRLRSEVMLKLRLFFQDASGILACALDDFCVYYQKVTEKKEASDLALSKVNSAELRPSAAVWRHAFLILIERGKPITVDKLSSFILESGYVTKSKSFQKYVMQELRKKPYFVQLKDGRWGLANWHK